MVSEKPWRSEAILRLILSAVLSLFLGMLAISAIEFADSGKSENLTLFALLSVAAGIANAIALLMLQKPWPVETFTRQFGVLLALVYLAITLGAFAQHAAGDVREMKASWRALIAAASLDGTAILFTLRFLREHRLTVREGFGLNKKWPMAVAYGALTALAFLPFGWLLQQGCIWLLTQVHLQPELQSTFEALQATTTAMDHIVMGLTIIVLAPVAEEIIFRGILYPTIKQAGHPRLALWGVAFVFALIHFNAAILIPLLLLALLLAWLYEYTDNLLAPIAAHVCFNALNFAKYYVLEGRFE